MREIPSSEAESLINESEEHESSLQESIAKIEQEIASMRGYVYGLLLKRLKNKDDAEDATQTTLMKATSGVQRGLLKERKKLKPWITRIATNEAANIFNRRKRRRESFQSETIDSFPDSKDISTDDLLERKEKRELNKDYRIRG